MNVTFFQFIAYFFIESLPITDLFFFYTCLCAFQLLHAIVLHFLPTFIGQQLTQRFFCNQNE